MNDPFFSPHQQQPDKSGNLLGNPIIGSLLLSGVAVSFLFSCKDLRVSMQFNDLHFTTAQQKEYTYPHSQRASMWGEISSGNQAAPTDWSAWLAAENQASAASNAEQPQAGVTAEQSAAQRKREKQLQYIQRFGPIAQAEMKRYGIPASITLAQGLLESNVGESKLARSFKNHFGIKCFEKHCTPGHCGNYSDDSHKDFFRRYNSAWESYRAHSLFLQKDRYQSLFKLSKRDYKSWAHGLKKAGYATDKQYAYKLIRLIEDLRLYEWDKSK
ncbi:MAG: glucosaminidase domain-containing protein [Phaeodactylibacter sp.]|nr:glucosaminidase domain-containing protein [Phaeodactylibacter sp.]